MSVDVKVFSDPSNKVNDGKVISDNVGLYFKSGDGYNYFFGKIQNPINDSSTNNPTFKGIEYNNNKIHTIKIDSIYLKDNEIDSNKMKIEIKKISDIRTEIENI